MRAVFTTSSAVYACSTRKDDAIANSPDDEPLTSRLKIEGDPGPGVEPVTRLAHTFKAISATKPALAATKNMHSVSSAGSDGITATIVGRSASVDTAASIGMCVAGVRRHWRVRRHW
ncbi:hypothetical protein P43SY_004290 [Pythium insidiosum]|uniref:Uncharacterized protein n=1 Tax=Pythium insidiosum TaxID=114742 RepID=A0AAD5Q1Q8_PYTIN|nr:hypothetical protein P43SY_004290 [Pythium insidiosum]